MWVNTAKRPEKKTIKTNKNKKNKFAIFLIWYNSCRLAHRIAQCAALPSLQGEGLGVGSVTYSLSLLRCLFFAASSSLIKYYRFNFRKFWS